MKAIASSSDVDTTVNDAVLAVSTGALRRLFEHRRAEIPSDFAALVPMSIRKPGEELALGNRITTLMVPLPFGEPDPLLRLRRIHETTSRLKRSEAGRAASLVIEASGWVPPTITRVLGQVGSIGGAAAERTGVSRVVPQRIPWNLVISNVPGPPMPVYLLGRRLRSIHPFVPSPHSGGRSRSASSATTAVSTSASSATAIGCATWTTSPLSSTTSSPR